MIRLIKEKSFRKEDIPSQFFLVTDFEYNVNFEDLKKDVLKGVSGISGSFEIVLNFMGVARDMIITMDGPSLVQMNALSRIMYGNPHYLVSNDMDALFRIFQDKKDLSSRFAYSHVFHNIFDYCKMFMKRSSNNAYDNLYLELFKKIEELKKYYEVNIIDIPEFKKIQGQIMSDTDRENRASKLISKYPVLEI